TVVRSGNGWQVVCCGCHSAYGCIFEVCWIACCAVRTRYDNESNKQEKHIQYNFQPYIAFVDLGLIDLANQINQCRYKTNCQYRIAERYCCHVYIEPMAF